MSDQDHIANGTTTTSSEGAAPRSAERAEPEASVLTNVLPFPRDWFGPIEELHPVNLDPPEASNPGASTVSAAAFWDEDADAVHQLVEFPEGDFGCAGELADEATEPLVPLTPLTVEPGVPPSRSRRRRLTMVVVALLLVCAVGAALVLVAGSLHLGSPTAGRSQSHGRRHRAPATVPAPALTITTTVTTVQKPQTPRHRTVHAKTSVKAASSSEPKPPVLTQAVNTAKPAVQHSSGASAKTGASSDSSSDAASGCAVQSPDSGCLP